MTRQEMAQKARDAALELEAAGWDYDDARFATMALVNGGILDEQLQGVSTPLFAELKAEFSKISLPEPKAERRYGNSDNEFEDQ